MSRRQFGPDGCLALIGDRICGEQETLQIIQQFKRLYESKLQQIEDEAGGGDCVPGLQAKVSLQQEWIRDLTQQNELLVRAVEELEQEASSRVAMLEQKLEMSVRKGSETVEELEAKKQMLENMEDKIREMPSQEDLDSIAAKLQAREEELIAVKRNSVSSEEDCAALRSRLAQAEDEIKALKDAIFEANQELEKLYEQANEYLAERDDYKRKHNECTAKISQLQGDLQAAGEEHKRASQANNEAVEALRKSNELTLAELQRARRDSEAMSQAQNETIEVLQEALKQKDQESKVIETASGVSWETMGVEEETGSAAIITAESVKGVQVESLPETISEAAGSSKGQPVAGSEEDSKQEALLCECNEYDETGQPKPVESGDIICECMSLYNVGEDGKVSGCHASHHEKTPESGVGQQRTISECAVGHGKPSIHVVPKAEISDYGLVQEGKVPAYGVEQGETPEYSVGQQEKASEYSVEQQGMPSEYSVEQQRKPSEYSVEQEGMPSRLSVEQQRKLSEYSEGQQRKLSEHGEEQLRKLPEYSEGQQRKLSEHSEGQQRKVSAYSEGQPGKMSDYGMGQVEMPEYGVGQLAGDEDVERALRRGSVGELQRTLERLVQQREAERASHSKEMANLKATINELERHPGGLEPDMQGDQCICALENELIQQQAQNTHLKQHLCALTCELTAMQRVINEAKQLHQRFLLLQEVHEDQLQETDAIRQELIRQAKLSEMDTTRIEELQHMLCEKTCQLSQFEQEYYSTQRELETALSHNQELKNEVAQLIIHIKRYEQSCMENEERTDFCEQEIEGCKSNLNEMKEKLVMISELLHEKIEQYNQLETSYYVQSNALACLKQQLAGKESCEEDVDDLRRTNEKLKCQICSLQTSMALSQEHAQATCGKLSKCLEDMSNLRAQRLCLETRNEQFRTELQDLQTAYDDLSQSYNRMRKMMEAMKCKCCKNHNVNQQQPRGCYNPAESYTSQTNVDSTVTVSSTDEVYMYEETEEDYMEDDCSPCPILKRVENMTQQVQNTNKYWQSQLGDHDYMVTRDQ